MRMRTRPCPVYLPDMSNTQKRTVRKRWQGHLDAWLLEHDAVYMSNISNCVERVAKGAMTREGFAKTRKTLIERSLRRGHALLTDSMHNAAVADYWKQEYRDAKKYPEMEVCS